MILPSATGPGKNCWSLHLLSRYGACTYDCRSRGRNLSTRVCPYSYWLTKILERRNSSYPVNLRVPLHSPNDSIHSSCLMRATVAVMPQRDRLSSVVPLCSCSSGFECDSNATSGAHGTCRCDADVVVRIVLGQQPGLHHRASEQEESL
jgi:hypothetical protein